MSLSSKTLLFLSADHFQVYAWHAGKLSAGEYFSNDPDGRDSLAHYLQEHQDPAFLLVDVIEEDFRHESVPHLVGPSRRGLIDRKFEQYYRNTLFRQARVLHRQSDGRRDDEMLFSALTNPQRISPWLETILNVRTPLIGIYSVPNISTPLLKDVHSDHILLLSWEKHAGLRQTYFNNKRLHFSRLTPLSAHNSFSDTVLAETPRTQQYLKSLSLPPPGEILDVCIICHADDKSSLESNLESSTDLQYHYLDIQTLGEHIKAKTDYQDSDATPLFLHLLASKPPTSHYATSAHTHFYTLWQLRLIFFGLAVVIAVAGALWSSISFWQGQEFVAETEPLLHQAEQLSQQAEAIKRQFPVTSIPASDMKTAVTFMRQFDHYSPLTEMYLMGLTKSLNQFTQVAPTKVAWQVSATDAPPSPYPAQVITFEGQLRDFGNDYRSALSYLERFQQSLIQQGYLVTVVKTPLDISPKGSISGNQQNDTEQSTQFILKLIWRNPG